LLVVGREDRIVDPEESIEAAQLLPEGRLHVLEHCGHAPQMEQPETINRLVVEFLTQPLPPALQMSRAARTCAVS
jgi:pimeloyl-ACP methyl ester carboxylesterase